jgi:hypothetical protein
LGRYRQSVSRLPLPLGSLVATVLLIALSATGCHAQQRDSAAITARDNLLRARYPSLPAESVIRYGTTLGTADTATFAIAEERIADRATGRFRSIEVVGIGCLNDRTSGG